MDVWHSIGAALGHETLPAVLLRLFARRRRIAAVGRVSGSADHWGFGSRVRTAHGVRHDVSEPKNHADIFTDTYRGKVFRADLRAAGINAGRCSSGLRGSALCSFGWHAVWTAADSVLAR